MSTIGSSRRPRRRLPLALSVAFVVASCATSAGRGGEPSALAPALSGTAVAPPASGSVPEAPLPAMPLPAIPAGKPRAAPESAPPSIPIPQPPVAQAPESAPSAGPIDDVLVVPAPKRARPSVEAPASPPSPRAATQSGADRAVAPEAVPSGAAEREIAKAQPPPVEQASPSPPLAVERRGSPGPEAIEERPAPIAAPPPAPEAPQDPGGTAQAGSASSDELSRTVYARPGDEITIDLDGSGWIFTGTGSWKDGLRYVSRTLDPGGTTFLFQAQALGLYSLAFQRQDLASGIMTSKLVKVSVLDPGDFAKALSGSGVGSAAAGAAESAAATIPGNGSGDYAEAEELVSEGDLPGALAAYETNYAPGNPRVNDTIASLAYRTGKYRDARSFWERNLTPAGSVYAELALAGLVKNAAAAHDVGELRALFSRVKGVTQVQLRGELLAAGRFLSSNGASLLAAKYLEEYLRRYPTDQASDEAYYLLGKLYQANGPLQSMRKARDDYEEILDLFPASDYYDRAEARIAYLDRNFFEIR